MRRHSPGARRTPRPGGCTARTQSGSSIPQGRKCGKLHDVGFFLKKMVFYLWYLLGKYHGVWRQLSKMNLHWKQKKHAIHKGISNQKINKSTSIPFKDLSPQILGSSSLLSSQSGSPSHCHRLGRQRPSSQRNSPEVQVEFSESIRKHNIISIWALSGETAVVIKLCTQRNKIWQALIN